MNGTDELDPLAERPNLDFSKGDRGTYAQRMKESSNIVVIDDDLLSMFPNQDAVNAALRGLKQLAERAAHTKAS